MFYAKCRFCSENIFTCLQQKFCPQHGCLDNDKYIMYAVESASNSTKVRKPNNTQLTCLKECIYLKDFKRCSFGLNCIFAHSAIELNLWKRSLEHKFDDMIDNKRMKELDMKRIFNRGQTLHLIVNKGDLNQFIDFIKFSESDILNDCNYLGESILHVCVKNKNETFINFLLNEIWKNYFESKRCPSANFKDFINRKSNNGQSAFLLFINTFCSADIDDTTSTIFNLFVECEDCDLEEATSFNFSNKRLLEILEYAQYERKLFNC